MDTISKLKLEGIYFRNCVYEDIPQVMYVNRKVLPENYSRSTFLGMYELYKDIFFVAVNPEDEIVGYIINKIDITRSFFEKDQIVTKGHVFSIGVLPEYRRRGLATCLLALGVVSLVRNRNAKEFFLEVRESNKPAISLYKKFGMKILGEIPYYYADGETAYVMAARRDEIYPYSEKIVKRIEELNKLHVV